MTTRKSVWLDLEDTIITPVVDGWWKTELINVEKIKRIIDDFNPDSVNIFSFAIWNQKELQSFNSAVRPLIEQHLGRKLSSIPTVDDEIIPTCCAVLGLQRNTVDFSEASAFWSKHQAFRLCCRQLFKNIWATWQHETEVLFLDDVVWNETFEWPDIKVKGQIINIDTIN